MTEGNRAQSVASYTDRPTIAIESYCTDLLRRIHCYVSSESENGSYLRKF